MSPTFPALAFRRDVGRHAQAGRERLTWFLDAEDFSTCTSWELKHGERLGMMLVGPDLRCWEIVRVVDLGVSGPRWERLLRFPVRQSVHQIDQEVAELASMSLEELKARTVASIQTNPDDWRDDEGIAGETAPPGTSRNSWMNSRLASAPPVPCRRSSTPSMESALRAERLWRGFRPGPCSSVQGVDLHAFPATWRKRAGMQGCQEAGWRWGRSNASPSPLWPALTHGWRPAPTPSALSWAIAQQGSRAVADGRTSSLA